MINLKIRQNDVTAIGHQCPIGFQRPFGNRQPVAERVCLVNDYCNQISLAQSDHIKQFLLYKQINPGRSSHCTREQAKFGL